MLETIRNFGASSPLSSSSAKYFWCARMEAVNTSGGKLMKAGSMLPVSTIGHSTRPVTSLSKPGSSLSVSFAVVAAFRSASAICLRRASASSTT